MFGDFLILLLLVSADAGLVTSSQTPTPIDLIWQSWKALHQKQYASDDEQQLRRSIWQQRVDEMTAHNLRFEVGLESYKKGLNQFSDMIWEELEAMYLRSLDMSQLELNDNYKTMPPVDVNSLPDSVDWVEKGWVTYVKNQGQCGSCWAFSAVGVLEGQMVNKTEEFIPLSAQQLVDCDYSSWGCNGGWPASTLKYTARKGIEDFIGYPYKARRGQCAYKANAIAFKNSGSLFVPYAGEHRLAEMVAYRGPISVAVQVTSDFYHYSSGVYTTNQCSKGRVNHAVLAVGYGKDDQSGHDFWLIKNSWGRYWGDKGYIKMVRNQDDMCNTALYPVAAIV